MTPPPDQFACGTGTRDPEAANPATEGLRQNAGTGAWLQAQIDTNLQRVYGAPEGNALPDRLEQLLEVLRRAEAERRAQPADRSRSQV